MNSSPLSSSYLPHLNGLRAVAILGVLFYHLNAGYCPAGYFGVDLFLVISGFLLLRSLLKPGMETSFHYGSFLQKKAWRILPPWIVVAVVACIVAVWLLPNYERLAPALKTAQASSLFYADYYIDESGDYFNTFTQQNPLLHFWYLSITQQLYLIAPLLVIPLARWCSRRAAMVLLGVLSVLSLAYYILTTSYTLLPDTSRTALLAALGTKSSYYHLVPRFWEITAGVAVFLLPEFGAWPRLRSLLGLLGLAGIISSFYLYSTGSPAVYFAVISSLLALRYAHSGPAAWLLSLKPVQALGTISFSLYLWHWPLMVFWKYYRMDVPGAWDEVGMIVISLLLGTLGWWTLERLRMPRLTGWRSGLLSGSLLALILIAFIGFGKADKHFCEQAEQQAAQAAEAARVAADAKAQETPAAQPGDAAAEATPPREPVPVQELGAEEARGLERLPELGMSKKPQRLGEPNAEPCFFLMGDSHAGHLVVGLHEACLREGMSGVFLNNSTAPYWYLTTPKELPDLCCWNEEIAQTILDYLKLHPNLRYVFIAQRWIGRLTSCAGLDWRTGKAVEKGRERRLLASEGLGVLCDILRKQGVEVVLLGDTPTFLSSQGPAPIDEWQRCQALGVEYKERFVTFEDHKRIQQSPLALHEKIAAEGRAHYINLAVAMEENGAYPARSNGEFLYKDYCHLTDLGSRRVGDYLIASFLEIMKKEPLKPAASPETAPSN